MKKITALILVLVLCLGIIPMAFAEQEKTDDDRLRVYCIGDSLTFGVIPNTAGKREVTYPDVLAELLGEKFEVVNLGKPGRSLTEAGVCYLKQADYQQSLEAAADMYIIMLGTNDSNLWEKWDAEAFEHDLNMVVDAYKQVNPNTKVILIAPPTVLPDDKTGEIKMDKSLLEGFIRDTVRKVAEEKGDGFIDMFAETEEHPDWIGADGIHFTQEGYTSFGQLVYETVIKLVPLHNLACESSLGTADFGTKEIEHMDNEETYYLELREAEKYNYKILRNIPCAFDDEDFDAYTTTVEKAIRGNKLGDKQRGLLDETLKLRRGMKRIRSSEDTMWMLWGESIPIAIHNEEMDFDGSYDNPDFVPYLVPYLLEDQSTVKGNLIVVAGGAYSGRNNRTEGFPIVDAFNSLGYNCFLLQRRLTPYDVKDIWMDMQRSIRLVRNKVETLALGGGDCIGAAGFSGGSWTVIGSITYYYGDIQPSETDPDYVPDEIDTYQADLDVALCIYGPDPEMNDDTPYEGLVTENENLPAMFLVAGMLDNYNAQYDNMTLAKSVMDKTMVENHAFANVPHGFGIGVEGTNSMYWVEMADCFVDQVITAKSEEADQ